MTTMTCRQLVSSIGMDNRADVREFLMSRRARVNPEAAEPFQASASVGGLTNQLRDILARVPLCQIELDRPVELTELGDGEVLLDGKALELGSPDGFRLKDSRHLEIVGEACKTLRASGKRLSVRISCD